jgi:hypothetical protein
MGLIQEFRDLGIEGILSIKLIERSDSTNPKSLRGVGPYAPYGPEAAI